MVFAALFGLNEVTRRSKWAGFAAFVVLPEACIRDFEVGATYQSVVTAASAFKDGAYSFNLIGGPWNYMNGIAGILTFSPSPACSASASARRPQKTRATI